ncbi:1468_t:CDS:2 [Ambispora leptoticha]|uniref:1468_t:CDS:1 n=1 Tax=Ambispora leptoticha TaxID=144679 RepID=A0A9N9BBV6_9GLOM|nr:1468_t:CDS:2 [Ambispora leptoticha]
MPITQIPNLQALTVLEPYATSIIYGNKRLKLRSYQIEIPMNSASERLSSWKLWQNPLMGKVYRCLKAEEIPDDEV